MMKREPILKPSTDYTDSFINLRNLWMVLLALIVLVDVHAQQPASSPSPQPSSNGNGDALGRYGVVSSIEFGYRGLSVDRDHDKYRSDLNYSAGPRLFDTSFVLKAKEGHNGGLFDTLLVTSTGWGADPYGQMRISVENPKWYRFDGSYRRFKYFRSLNTIANPNWVFSPPEFSVPPNPVTGEHRFDTRQQLGDFDLTILPKNDLIRFNVGFSPERTTLDLNALSAAGVEIVGRLAAVRDGRALFSGGLRNQFALADLKMNRLLDSFDEWARGAPDFAVGPPERFEPTHAPNAPRLSLDLNSGEIRSIVWATGFRPDYRWLEVPVVDRRGELRHDGGVVAEAPGLYAIGLPVLRRRKSTFIHGAEDDARDIVEHLARSL